LLAAGLVTLTLAAVIVAGLVPAQGFLRDPETGSILRSPLMEGIVVVIFVLGAVAGIAYGVVAGTLRNDADVVQSMGKAMQTLGTYMVLVFFAAQFVGYFRWTNLGLILAIRGAELLRASGLGPIPLLTAFILLTAAMNLFMGSASAKWAVMAPIFIPMFMLLFVVPVGRDSEVFLPVHA